MSDAEEKPEQKPAWMSRTEYEAMPAELTLRLLRVRVQEKTKRVRKLELVTTLRDAVRYPKKEVGALFRQRWHAELDIRTLKSQMQMEMLRTKSPEMVGKEVAMHLLAYNLIRGIMAEAARAAKRRPKPHPLLQMPRKAARRLIERGRIPYDKKKYKQ